MVSSLHWNTSLYRPLIYIIFFGLQALSEKQCIPQTAALRGLVALEAVSYIVPAGHFVANLQLVDGCQQSPIILHDKLTRVSVLKERVQKVSSMLSLLSGETSHVWHKLAAQKIGQLFSADAKEGHLRSKATKA